MIPVVAGCVLPTAAIEQEFLRENPRYTTDYAETATADKQKKVAAAETAATSVHVT